MATCGDINHQTRCPLRKPAYRGTKVAEKWQARGIYAELPPNPVN